MQSASTLVIGFAGLTLWGIAVVAGARNIGTAEETASEFDPSTMETIDITDVPPAAEPEISSEASSALEPAAQDGEQQSAGLPEENAAEAASTGTIIAQTQPQQSSGTQTATGQGEGIALPRPQTAEAGILTFGDRILKLADIEPTDPARTCTGAGGTQWPCGMLARTQQRLFIRNRTVTCDVDGAEWQGTLETRCRLGEIDLSSWLAENGWVETPQGSPLRPLTEKARSARLGLFGGDPR